jgi:hypothetical protein
MDRVICSAVVPLRTAMILVAGRVDVGDQGVQLAPERAVSAFLLIGACADVSGRSHCRSTIGRR